MQTALTPQREVYAKLLGRLSARSVKKHHDAYADIDWDHPENEVHPEDPRFALAEDEPLAATSWYRALPEPARARLGLHHAVRMMKTGIEFESVLSRGLLEFAGTRPNGSPEFRYAYHEVIEEAQHSLMFQELVNRSGFDVRGLGALEKVGARLVPALGRTFPELFFLHVLAGETPIDSVQRRALASGGAAHPLMRRILQIHVTEEARHVCFALRFLEENVPRLGPLARARLRLYTPFVLAGTVAPMLRLSGDVVRTHDIPAAVVREVHASEAHRARVQEGVRPVRELARKIDLLTRRTEWLWTWLGL